MLASRVLITAGTPGHMYLDDKQAKWLLEVKNKHLEHVLAPDIPVTMSIVDVKRD